ncbi:MAG: hypothetical protein QW607_04930 [Desulfurococcaceae archaeon]
MSLVDVIYVETTMTFGSGGKSSAINYGIVNERQISRTDVVIIRSIPKSIDTIYVPDPEAGLTEADSFRRKLTILTGSLTQDKGFYTLVNSRVVKEIDSELISSELIRVSEGMESGTIPYTNNNVLIDGINFKILSFKPPKTIEDFASLLIYLYIRTSGKKRVMIASPSFVELYIGSETKWCVVTIPRVLPYLWRVPNALVTAGIIDPDGFNAPFLVVRDMSWRELARGKGISEAVKWLSNIISRSSKIEEESRGGEGEEPSL